MPNPQSPLAGQIYRVREDGVWEFFFDAHTIASYLECETKWMYKHHSFAPQTLRKKGPISAPMSIGSWWSRVSELFYKKCAAAQAVGGECPSMIDMLCIAGQAWVDCDMDAMEKAGPRFAEKYEKFAIPIRSGELPKYFPQASFAEQFLAMYSGKAKQLRKQAESLKLNAISDYAVNSGDNEYIASEIDRLYQQARELEQRAALPLGPLLMAAQYYNNFAPNDFRDWKIISAEVPFGRHGDICLGEQDGVTVYWQGKPDLVIYEQSSNVVAPLDQKTKDYIPYNVNEIWKPHLQLAGYVYSLGQIARDLGYEQTPDRCIFSVCGRLQPAVDKNTKLPKARFARIRVQFSVDEIEEWRLNILRVAKRLRSSIEDNRFTRNDGFICHIYSGCDFRPLCARPAGVRPIVIQSDYVVTDPWSAFDDED